MKYIFLILLSLSCMSMTLGPKYPLYNYASICWNTGWGKPKCLTIQGDSDQVCWCREDPYGGSCSCMPPSEMHHLDYIDYTRYWLEKYLFPSTP